MFSTLGHGLPWAGWDDFSAPRSRPALFPACCESMCLVIAIGHRSSELDR